MNNARPLLLAIVCGSLMSCAANTTDDSASRPSSTQIASSLNSSDNRADDVICRKEIVTGSNMRRKICRTRAEREKSTQDNRELVNEAFQR